MARQKSPEKQAADILKAADELAGELTAAWVKLLRRERAVIKSKVTGPKARAGTKFWDPGTEHLTAPNLETQDRTRSERPGTVLLVKAFNPAKWIDKARWLKEIGDDTRDLLHRFFVAYFKRGGMDDDAAEELAEALTNERVDSTIEWHEGYLDRLAELAKDAAEKEGSTIQDVVAAIEVAFDAAEEHANAVALSQAIGSANQAQIEMVRKLGIKGKKVWFSSMDERVRPIHRKPTHGQRVDIDKPFKVSGVEMDYPGDREAPPGHWINCRCVVLFYPTTDSGEPVSGLEAASAYHGLREELNRQLLDRLETKGIRVRRVRTPGGARVYDQPIGSVIKPEVVPRIAPVSVPKVDLSKLRPTPPIRDLSGWGNRAADIETLARTIDRTALDATEPDTWRWNRDEYINRPDVVRALEEIYNFTDEKTGLQQRVMLVERVGNRRWRVSGKIDDTLTVDQYGAKTAGRWEKVIDLGTEPPSAFHGLIALWDEYQGRGFGERLLRYEENAYVALGIEHVDLLAGLTGGGYAWARAGFDWRFSPGAFRFPWFRVLTELKNHEVGAEENGDDETRGLLTGIIERFREAETQLYRMATRQPGFRVPDDVDLPTPYEIARLGTPGNKQLGKTILRGTEWEARKTLIPPKIPGEKPPIEAKADGHQGHRHTKRELFLARVAEMWWRELEHRPEPGADGIDWKHRDDQSEDAPGPEAKAAVRRVRTPAGARRYGQPVGSRIVVDWNKPDLVVTGYGSASGGGSYAEPAAVDAAIRRKVVAKRNTYFAAELPEGTKFEGQTDPDRIASRISAAWRQAALSYESEDTTVANALRIAAVSALDVPGGEYKTERAANAQKFYDANKAALDAFAKAQYRATQEYLDAEGIEFLRGFRGANYDDEDDDSPNFPAWLKKADGKNGWVEVDPPDGALTSHSTSFKAAAIFGDSTGGKSVILRSVIPAEEVFGLYRTGLGMYGEDEVVTRGRVVSEARVYDPRDLDDLFGEESREREVTRAFLRGDGDDGDEDEETETKGVRKVRTPEGAEHYGQPIGSVIVADVDPLRDRWYHSSFSEKFPTSGWVHVGTAQTARDRAENEGDRTHTFEVRFIGETYNTQDEDDLVPDKLANYVTGNEDWELDEVMRDLQIWHETEGGPDPETYFNEVMAAAEAGKGIYYANTWDGDTMQVSLVAPATSFETTAQSPRGMTPDESDVPGAKVPGPVGALTTRRPRAGGGIGSADASKVVTHQSDPDRHERLLQLYAEGLEQKGRQQDWLFDEGNRSRAKREVAKGLVQRLDGDTLRQLAVQVARDEVRSLHRMADRWEVDPDDIPIDPFDPRLIWSQREGESGKTPWKLDVFQNFAALFPGREGDWSDTARHRGYPLNPKTGDTAKVELSPYTYRRGPDPELERGLAEDGMSSFVANWADTSNDNSLVALAVQEAIKEEFGLGETMEWTDPTELFPEPQPSEYHTREIYEHRVEMWRRDRERRRQEAAEQKALVPLYRKLVRAQYDNTQQWFKDHGISELLIYRGMKWGPADTPPNWWHQASTLSFSTETVEVDGEPITEEVWPTIDMPLLRPASSWAWGSRTARNFAGQETSAKDVAIMQALGQAVPVEQPSAVLATVVPVEAILGTPRTGFGALPEEEIVLLASGGTTQVLVGGKGRE